MAFPIQDRHKNFVLYKITNEKIGTMPLENLTKGWSGFVPSQRLVSDKFDVNGSTITSNKEERQHDTGYFRSDGCITWHKSNNDEKVTTKRLFGQVLYEWSRKVEKRPYEVWAKYGKFLDLIRIDCYSKFHHITVFI